MTGPYTLVGTITSTTVIEPSGDIPTETDYLSHRYHHHTRIWVDGNTIWLACSSAGAGEGDDGMQSIVFISTNRGVNWTDPICVVPSQSTWSTNHYSTGSRFSFPRNFQKYDGTNYLVCAIEYTVDPEGHETAAALAACSLSSSGIGPLFLISTNEYLATNGAATIPTNFVLRAGLMPYSKVYGCWGGSTSGGDKEWIGFLWDATAGRGYLEPNTFSQDGTTDNLYRLWRHYTGAPMTYFTYLATSTDAGSTWAWPVVTGIPNSPAETTGIRLNNGQFAIVGNPQSLVADARDPLFLALTSAGTTEITNVWAIRQGIGGTPDYAGYSKYGGAQYPGVVQAGNYLYVSYSIHKESVGFSRVLIPGMDDNNNDGPVIATSKINTSLLRAGTLRGK